MFSVDCNKVLGWLHRLVRPFVSINFFLQNIELSVQVSFELLKPFPVFLIGGITKLE